MKKASANKGAIAANSRRGYVSDEEVLAQSLVLQNLSKRLSNVAAIMQSHGQKALHIDGVKKFDNCCPQLETYIKNLSNAMNEVKDSEI